MTLRDLVDKRARRAVAPVVPTLRVPVCFASLYIVSSS
ncbi:hypothetical protein IEO21_04467 [Rhodonia placenta]|uniref:Uncharacterized protein n=1 Tax=Rhodonia placenta TaxID=104341 RepID=A0A8H7P3Q9_9APHY|nr:hypothetical protein IEO21_04467 [Postia placenta]